MAPCSYYRSIVKFDGGRSRPPATRQLTWRNDEGRLIVTISSNSIGNAITEPLGIVVRRVPDAEACARAEPALIARPPDVLRCSILV